jgi:hypothetical protein
MARRRKQLSGSKAHHETQAKSYARDAVKRAEAGMAYIAHKKNPSFVDCRAAMLQHEVASNFTGEAAAHYRESGARSPYDMTPVLNAKDATSDLGWEIRTRCFRRKK